MSFCSALPKPAGIKATTEPSLSSPRSVRYRQYRYDGQSTARASDSIPIGRPCSARLPQAFGGQAASFNRDFIRD